MKVGRALGGLLPSIRKKRLKRRAARLAAMAQTEKLRSIVATEANRLAGLFDPEWYAMANPDVAAEGQDPFYHYINHGYMEDRDPGPNFDTKFYKLTYPDVIGSGQIPLIHFLEFGVLEGRVCNSRALRSEQAGEVRHVIFKELFFVEGRDAAVLVTHAPAGRLKPHVLPFIEQLHGTGISVLLTVVADRPLELRQQEIAAADGIIVRDNAGYDFGAWAHSMQLFPKLFAANMLIWTNDSIVPTADTEIFGSMVDRVRSCPADVVALTASHEYGWHLQSYFVALKPAALGSWAFQHFVRDMKLINDKDEVIRQYEIPFAARMRGAGLVVEAIYSGSFSANPTFFSWRELIEDGFPFIKLLMLRRQFAQSTDQLDFLEEVQRDWPEVLAKAGFDVDLVRASLQAAEIASVPAGSSRALLVDERKVDDITDDHRLRVAYFGPWNYENGLGAASREMLGALRLTGVDINAYPITKPFHIHRLICPAIETLDFRGRPDVAIVHLNPDSWNVLTTDQRNIIKSAKRRIGYWVWETDRLPPSWQQELHSVDRIWTPSTYCAEVFSKEVGVPIDVVPHPVRVPIAKGEGRKGILERFGIDPERRVILYIFDGASYLVRKNPHALIRAFATSGLAAQGWTLLLKTKHLHDRPDAGKELSQLAESTPEVRIVEASLHADEVTSLLAAADIYASPHCSEGFGLTVAEAMALGRPVVATDFAGTRDFLDETCGYPVASTVWTLEEDHGHYLAGHSWARIDEKALAEALTRAAKAIAGGDASIGSAAQENIGRLLSYEAIAKSITGSFSRLVAGDNEEAPVVRAKSHAVVSPPSVTEIKVNAANAARFRDFSAADGLVPVALRDDLSWDGTPIPAGDSNDWVIFAPGKCRIAPNASHFFLSAATDRPDVGLFYADDAASAGEMIDRVRLKPEFDRTLLGAQDYIGAPVSIRRKVLESIGGLRHDQGSATLYDLVLRVHEAGAVIGRIPHVLIAYDQERPAVDVEDRRAALRSKKGYGGVALLDGAAPGLISLRRRFEAGQHPSVTIVIPTRRASRAGSSQTYVERLLTGIADTRWPMDRLTVIVGDDVSESPEWAQCDWAFTLRRVETPRPEGRRFNYAAKMNRLWRMAVDEQIVMMNDDVVPQNPDWLSALLTFAVDDSVGGVGGRLHYEDGSLQHAGMFPTHRTIAHAWLGWPADAKTYQDWAFCQREWSAVTGAVFATRRSILEQVDGFDERFSLEFNDVDICLRMRNLGYRIVYNPEAIFTHAEKASRGAAIPPGEEVALFLTRWARWLDHDPASHPLLAKNRIDLVPAPEHDSWYT